MLPALHAPDRPPCQGFPCPLQITLDPCTILQPHIHPHAEFAFTVTGGFYERLLQAGWLKSP